MIKPVSAGATSSLLTYLLNHESEIAHQINDFYDLYLVFYELLGYTPSKDACIPTDAKISAAIRRASESKTNE